MNASTVFCTRCRTPLPPAMFNRRQLTPCPFCGTRIKVAAFAALLAGPAAGKTGEVLVTDDEASCFYHPGKKAVVPCDACGRFLCALCDVEMGGRHLCPACIEPGGARSRHTDLDDRRTLYDSLALLAAIVVPVAGLLIALYLAIRYWSAPTSLLGRTKVRWVLAIAFAFLNTANFCWLWFR